MDNLWEEFDIEESFREGGYELIDSIFHGVRMPKSMSKNISQKAYHRWIRYLRWRWLHQHPDFSKKQNKYYAEKRQKEKPYVCICKKCGKEFNAPRKCYKICPNCRIYPSLRNIKKQNAEKRLKKKIGDIQEAQVWARMGLSQQTIADHFAVSQKTISNWVNNKNKLK